MQIEHGACLNGCIPGTRVEIEVDARQLFEWFASGEVNATDVRCLKCGSCHCMWHQCLQSQSNLSDRSNNES